MKKLLILCISILSLSSFTFGVSKKEGLVNKIMHQHAKLLKSRYNLIISGIGSSIPDYVKGFKTHFRSNRNLNIVQARKLYIETSQILLHSINSNEQLRQYMYKYPFDHNDLEYSIAFYPTQGRRASEEYMAYISLVEGNICYRSYDHTKQEFVRRHKETYEEALRIVQGAE